MPDAVMSPTGEPVLWSESELLSQLFLLLSPSPSESRKEESLPSV